MVFIVHDVCDILWVKQLVKPVAGHYGFQEASPLQKMYLRQPLEPIGHGTQICQELSRLERLADAVTESGHDNS